MCLPRNNPCSGADQAFENMLLILSVAARCNWISGRALLKLLTPLTAQTRSRCSFCTNRTLLKPHKLHAAHYCHAHGQVESLSAHMALVLASHLMAETESATPSTAATANNTANTSTAANTAANTATADAAPTTASPQEPAAAALSLPTAPPPTAEEALTEVIRAADQVSLRCT
jgi:hypothetical protein